MIGNLKVVDGHVHTFVSDEVALKIIESFNKIYNIEFENPGSGSIENVLNNMLLNSIDYTIMANFAPPKIVHSNNMWALKTSKLNSKLVALVSFHPEMDGSMPRLLEEYIKQGAKGIKIHPMAQAYSPLDSRMQDIYKSCNEIAFPIVFHCGRVSNARLNNFADLDMILPVIEKYPDIPVILTHMADGNFEDVLRMAENYGNVYFDTSIVITGYPPIMNVNQPSWLDDEIVVALINKVGAEKILFGSDYPCGSPGHDLKRIIGMKLSEKQKQMILGENSIKLFKIF